MAPVTSRQDSYARAARAARLRAAGRSWAEIAKAEGFTTRSGAQRAVQRHYARETGTLDDQRHDASEGLRIVKSMLFAELFDARRSGDSQTVIASAKAITDVVEKSARLLGLHVPVRTEVAVTVEQTQAAILADTRKRLMEAVDAEVIEMRELEV